MTSSQTQSRTYEVVRMFTFDGISSRFARRDCFESVEFWSADDQPDPTKFVVSLFFGKHNDGVVSCGIRSTNRTTKASKLRITLQDADLSIIKQLEFQDKNIDLTPVIFCSNFFGRQSLANSGLDTVYFQCKISYGRNFDASSVPMMDRDVGLNDELLQLFERSEDADVQIIVGDVTYQAHRIIMTTGSEYFRSLFRSGLKESVSNEIKIDDVDPVIFKELLRFLYSGLPPGNLPSIALSMLPLADRFRLQGLRKACIAAISVNLDCSNVIEALFLAHAHVCPSLVEKCLPLIKANFKTLQTTEEWKRLEKNHELILKVLKYFGE